MKKLFKTKKDEQLWLKEHFLTVKDLINYLSKYDPDTLIYSQDQNGVYCECRKEKKFVVKTIAQDKKDQKKFLENWYNGYNPSVKNAKISKTLNEIYQYATNSGIVLTINS